VFTQDAQAHLADVGGERKIVTVGFKNGYVLGTVKFLIMASFSSVNWEEKHRIRIPVAFRLYLVKIIQILTN
jgi:hypothetical protein